MRRVVMIAMLFSLVPSVDATACSIAAQTPQERVRAAKIAVHVKVLSVRTIGTTKYGAERWEATVRRLKTFKGHPPRVFRVRSHADEAACGLAKLKPRERLGLLLDAPGPPYAIWLGSPISLSDLRSPTR